MSLQFERGDPNAPVGHALIYFRATDGSIFAAYINVPPIKFDVAKFVPPFMSNMLEGIDLSDAGMVMPLVPPIPEQVPGEQYLQQLAARRHDDLLYAGTVNPGDPMSMAAEAQQVALQYGEAYNATAELAPSGFESQVSTDSDRFAGLSQQEQLNELSNLTGRYLDALNSGSLNPEVEAEMRRLAGILPPKYRAEELIEAIRQPGERGRRLAELYIERAYKLYNEDYLDLQRIDREIETAHG